MRRYLVIVCALALLAAAPAASGDGGPSPGAVTGWDGVLNALGSARYVAFTAGRSTLVAEIEVEGGRVMRYRSLRGQYGIPLVAYDGTTAGTSADGTTLVLSWFPAPPGSGAVSRFVAIDTSRFGVRRTVTLRGTYSFDAISPTGRLLYLIQYLPSTSWTTYRVRAYDLAKGRLLPGAIVDRREPDEKMQGSPVTRATSRDGAWAYTLYARPSGKPFVHALDTRHRAAVCIDLPWTADQQALSDVRMAVAHRRLVLRDAAGRLAAVDTKSWKVKSYRAP
jgi:hypothetical protein